MPVTGVAADCNLGADKGGTATVMMKCRGPGSSECVRGIVSENTSSEGSQVANEGIFGNQVTTTTIAGTF